jgi:hypothetical protein
MAASIHPYRKDALEELATWGKLGVRVVKWLPPAMGIDPSHGKYFFRYQYLFVTRTMHKILRSVCTLKFHYLTN